MTGISIVVILALAVVTAYIYVLGRGARGESFSPMWPVRGTKLPGSEPAEEGAIITGDEAEAPEFATRKAA